MLARKALAGTAGAPKEYVEDVFSTYLWTGNATARDIVNGIDLAGDGGLVWTKRRNSTNVHQFTDTARGVSYQLDSASTAAQSNETNRLTAFNADGFSISTGTDVNANTGTYVSWTFRKAKKFFDVVTFTTSSSTNTNQRISHNLGSTPGCIIVKNTGSTSGWPVWHRSLPTTTSTYFFINTTDPESTYSNCWGTSGPTSTDFGINTNFFGTSANYVAYVFAHDAGGFGDAGSDSIIKCGSFNASSGAQDIDLGWEPQCVFMRESTNGGKWEMIDNMRGFLVGGDDTRLAGNSNIAENTLDIIDPIPNGFRYKANLGGTVVYVAIRRGPMKTPETGTSVFTPTAFSGNDTSGTRSAGLNAFDLLIAKRRGTSSADWVWLDKLRGLAGNKWLASNATTAEGGGDIINTINGQYTQDGINVTKTSNYSYIDASGSTYVWYALKRAPKFFDTVCYTGTGSSADITHNLGVVPELVIIKTRNQGGGWYTMANIGASSFSDLRLDTTSAATSRSYSDNAGFDAQPTATILNLDGSFRTNTNGYTHVAYLFASVSGVSKVGAYTGNGSSQTINCGFTNGARFVLIKQTDSAGNWYVFDTARGIITGNDPLLFLNSIDAEDTPARDAVDPDNSGFIVNNDATYFPINVNNATYIYLAIA